MENERMNKLKCFSSSLQRLLTSPKYIIQLLSAFLLAFISPYIVHAFVTAGSQMPPEIMEAFKISGRYNILVVSIPSLDVIKSPYCDPLITGVLSGSFSHCLIALITSWFIISEFGSGYINIALMRGENRFALFSKYVGVSVISTMPIVALYPLGIALSIAANGTFRLENPAATLTTVLVQAVMLCCLTACFASFTIMVGNIGAVFAEFSAALIFPFLPKYVSLFTGGKVDVEGFLLLSKLFSSGTMEPAEFVPNIILALITAAVFYCIGCFTFKATNFK